MRDTSNPVVRPDDFSELPADVYARFADFGQWPDTFFPTLIGVRLEELRYGYCRMLVPWKPELTQLAGLVHGGAIATLIDTVAVPAVGVMYEATSRLVTIDLHIQYHGGVRNESMIGEGWVTRRGRSIAFCEALVTTPTGVQVAKGNLTYMITARPEGPAER